MTGLYIHIPFCAGKCPYCDFYSLPFDGETADRYTAALLRAMKRHPFEGLRADTVYFGGGTPALLGPGRLLRLLEAAAAAFGVGAEAEITLETNPASTTREDLAALRRGGFNRLSVGVQSLEDGELAFLGRRHTAAEARRTLLDAADGGFGDISADLMLAIPAQTEASLAGSIDGLAALPVNHVSAYLLKVEPDTPFGRREAELEPLLPGGDDQADLYLDCVERLEGHGFRQYEISNFARGGRVSLHNRNYWRGGDYLGLGPAAHSSLGGRRFYLPRDLEAFAAAENPLSLAVDDGPAGGAAETLMLRLRLTGGVDAGALGLAPAQKEKLLARAKQLEGAGLALQEGDRVSLTPRGFLLSNPATGALLEAAGLWE